MQELFSVTSVRIMKGSIGYLGLNQFFCWIIQLNILLDSSKKSCTIVTGVHFFSLNHDFRGLLNFSQISKKIRILSEDQNFIQRNLFLLLDLSLFLSIHLLLLFCALNCLAISFHSLSWISQFFYDLSFFNIDIKMFMLFDCLRKFFKILKKSLMTLKGAFWCDFP